MRFADWLYFAGTEVSNSNRVISYLRSVGDPRFHVKQSDCDCEATDDGPYHLPESDPAPWYIPSRPDSAEFLGLLSEIRVLPSVRRSVTPRNRSGAVVGTLARSQRIVQVSGTLYASSARGMNFGERWLESVLSGTDSGCAPDELELLPACPDDDSQQWFRTLRHVGLVDGPVASQIGQVAECLIQQVSFQLVAGTPYLLSPPETILPATTLVAGQTYISSFVGAEVGDSAAEIRISSGSAEVSGIVVISEPAPGYSDTYSDSYGPSGGSYAEFEIDALPPETVLIVDAVENSVRVEEADTGRVVAGLEVLSYMGAFRFPVARNGVTQRVGIDATSATMNADTQATVLVYDRE